MNKVRLLFILILLLFISGCSDGDIKGDDALATSTPCLTPTTAGQLPPNTDSKVVSDNKAEIETALYEALNAAAWFNEYYNIYQNESAYNVYLNNTKPGGTNEGEVPISIMAEVHTTVGTAQRISVVYFDMYDTGIECRGVNLYFADEYEATKSLKNGYELVYNAEEVFVLGEPVCPKEKSFEGKAEKLEIIKKGMTAEAVEWLKNERTGTIYIQDFFMHEEAPCVLLELSDGTVILGNYDFAGDFIFLPDNCYSQGKDAPDFKAYREAAICVYKLTD